MPTIFSISVQTDAQYMRNSSILTFSTSYFRDVNGMRPYVSGKQGKLLQSQETNSYKDLYPTPNTNWYYAVTVVNGNGQEGKIVDAKKV